MKSQGVHSDAVHAIVPLKNLRSSKARLTPILDPANRNRLSTAMLVDVLRTLRRVRRIRRVTVVTGEQSVRSITRQMGAHFLWEGERRGLNRALRLAIRDASRRKAPAVLILPADIPLITPKEIGRLLTVTNGYAIGINPSKDGGGTNALLLRPPRMLNPLFGENSFQRHLSSAGRKGLSTRVVRLPRIASDVDEPNDLAQVTRLHLSNETGLLLKMMLNAKDV